MPQIWALAHVANEIKIKPCQHFVAGKASSKAQTNSRLMRSQSTPGLCNPDQKRAADSLDTFLHKKRSFNRLHHNRNRCEFVRCRHDIHCQASGSPAAAKQPLQHYVAEIGGIQHVPMLEQQGTSLLTLLALQSL